MKLIFVIIIFFLIYIILLVSFYGSIKKNIYEGFPGVNISSTDMQMPITKSDLTIALNEQIGNINKHELALSRINLNYKVSKPPSTSDLINIDTIHITGDEKKQIYKIVLPPYLITILNILKTEEKEIRSLLPTYIPSNEIDGLLNGSILSTRAKELYNKSRYPENMEDCDVKTIQKLIDGYQKLIDDNPDADSTNKTMWGTTIANLQMKQTAVKTIDSSIPNNTKCNPALSVTQAEAILDAIYINYIVKIIQSQEEAIQTIISNRDTKIINFYQNLT
jgi:hypothetical protein